MTLARIALLTLMACGSSDGTPTASAAPTADTPEVVAEVGGEPITMGDLMKFGGGEIVAAEVALHGARTQALDQLIMERLLEEEAAKHDMALDQWVSQEIDAKLNPPTEEEVQAFFQANQAGIRGSLDEVRPKLEGYLRQQKGAELLRTLVTRLETEAGVVKHLAPYRIDVPNRNGPLWGAEDAPVQIVEFSDFQCPYCTIGAETIRKVKDKYGDKVAVRFRHFPLPMHSEAPRAAEASECAREQGVFWEFHDALFAEQRAWTDDDYSTFAKKAGAKPKKLQECLESGRHAATVEADLEAGAAIGMGGTPGFYINGQVLSGAQPLEAFVALIDAELARTL